MIVLATKNKIAICKQSIVFVLLYCLMLANNAAAQNVCTISNPATAVQTSVLPYGAARDGGARSHRGVDIMIPMCKPVPNQPGCTVVPNGNSPLFKIGGYGLYTRYYCNPRVEVRYAHLNGWTGGMPSNGRSGAAKKTPPHVHYEVIISPNGSASGGYKVDPQCVWGNHPKPSSCCIGLGSDCGLGNAPANMCDNAVLDKLRKNAASRGYGKGLSTSMRITPGRPPESFPTTSPEKDEPECAELDPSETMPVEHEHDNILDELETGITTPVRGSGLPDDPLGAGGNDPDPPVIPPPPDIPGTPGGNPDLVPKSQDGGKGAETGCAVDTWTAMVNQAVLQTRRQDLTNKRFILKPDSVLDYTCFSALVSNVAEKAGPFFSESENWKKRKVDIIGKEVELDRYMGQKSLDNALMEVVETSIINYKNGQFNNPFLAGSAPISGSVGSSYCDVMKTVWQAAKCKNLNSDDVFYSFEDLTSKDPRAFPDNMRCD